VTKLILTYFAVIIPFHEWACPEFPRNGYVFPDGRGFHWVMNMQTDHQGAQAGQNFTVARVKRDILRSPAAAACGKAAQQVQATPGQHGTAAGAVGARVVGRAHVGVVARRPVPLGTERRATFVTLAGPTQNAGRG
jgi:hypothetical protein